MEQSIIYKSSQSSPKNFLRRRLLNGLASQQDWGRRLTSIRSYKSLTKPVDLLDQVILEELKVGRGFYY